MGRFRKRTIAAAIFGVLMVISAIDGLVADPDADAEVATQNASRDSEQESSRTTSDPKSTTSTTARPRTTTTTRPPATTTTRPVTTTTAAPPPAVLLVVTDRKDGDSFVASDGVEYRLGLVNTPEMSEQCGSAAAAFTYAFLADGFRAEGYQSDDYGRVVAEVFDADGDSLNVALAASGLGNDKYLDQFRHENPDLGARLDAAFASAPTPSCRQASTAPVPFAEPAPPPTTQPPAPTPAPSGSGCHPAYQPCIPNSPTDLDCGDIGVKVQVIGSDTYRFDRDGDGWGCESYG